MTFERVTAPVAVPAAGKVESSRSPARADETFVGLLRGAGNRATRHALEGRPPPRRLDRCAGMCQCGGACGGSKLEDEERFVASREALRYAVLARDRRSTQAPLVTARADTKQRERRLLRREGDYCTCTTTPSRDGYRSDTFDYIKKIAPLIKANVPAGDRLAVAGAIADENNTQHGARGVLDWLQDATIGSLTDDMIATDEYFDIHSKLLNSLENDIGPANIKLRTGLEYVRSGELIVPGSPKGGVKPHLVVAFLQSDEGTVKATAAVIKRAHGIFDDYLEDPGSYNSQAVRVEYFKQGPTYSDRALWGFYDDPDHVVCPGEGGCRVLYNLRKLEDAIK